MNYWCDLMRTEAPSGAPNDVARGRAGLAFLALAAGTLAFWWPASTLVPGRRAARATVALGAAASLGSALLVVLPFDTQRSWHAVITLSAGACGAVAVLIVLAGSLRLGPVLCARHAFGAVLVAAMLANIAVYADLVYGRGGESAALPVIQKVATAALLLWMAATALASLRRDVRGTMPDVRSRASTGDTP